MCSPDRRGRTLQSHRGQDFLIPFWPHIYKTWMLHYCTSQENNTCGNTNQKKSRTSSHFLIKTVKSEIINFIPYSKIQLFSSRVVEVEDVAGWKPQAVMFSKKAKQAEVQRGYFCSVQKEGRKKKLLSFERSDHFGAPKKILTWNKVTKCFSSVVKVK